MTILRDRQADDLRRFTAPSALHAVPDPAAPLRAAIAARDAEIELLQRELAAAQDDADRRVTAAFAAGQAEALGDDAARIQAVADGVLSAAHALDVQLGKLEQLAGALAELALEKLFGGELDHRPMVLATIAKAMSQLRASKALHVTVSALDFPAPAADALRVALGSTLLAVEDGLRTGEARIALELGEIDLSLDSQWALLRAALRAFGTPVAP